MQQLRAEAEEIHQLRERCLEERDRLYEKERLMDIALQESPETEALALVKPRSTDSTEALQGKKDLLNSMTNDAENRLKQRKNRRRRRFARAKEPAPEQNLESDRMLRDLTPPS